MSLPEEVVENLAALRLAATNSEYNGAHTELTDSTIRYAESLLQHLLEKNGFLPPDTSLTGYQKDRIYLDFSHRKHGTISYVISSDGNLRYLSKSSFLRFNLNTKEGLEDAVRLMLMTLNS